MTSLINRWLCLVVAATAGCASPEQHGSEPVAIRLTARLVSPLDVILEWHDPGSVAAGYMVEYTNDPREEYVPLGHFPPGATTFSHSQLLPETKFYYRVRAYYGPASIPVEVTLPETLTDEAYAARFALPEDFSWAEPMILPERVPVEKHSIRNPSPAARAAPSDLKAQLISPLTVSGFRLTWMDHAYDEEGFLLERQQLGSPEYAVCAVVETNITAFGWVLEPPQRTGSFRIRPYYCGQPSNGAVIQTGKKPELVSGQ